MKFTKLLLLCALSLLTIISCHKSGSSPTPATPAVIPLAVGQSYEGGYIFYLDSTGKHGLMAASGDVKVSTIWGCPGTLCGANGTAVGTGYQNTDTIVSGCDSIGIAAQLCKASVSGGYNNWFLPSKDELNLMYTNLYLKSIGGLFGNYYWSSTESDANNAWFQYFGSGLQSPYGKSYPFYVRPARAF